MAFTTHEETAAFQLFIRNAAYRSMMPSALPDRWLHTLVKAFREAELDNPESEDEITVPVIFLLHFVVGRATEVVGHPGPAPGQARMGRFAQIYQHYLERELVRRAVDLKVVEDDELLEHIDETIRASNEEYDDA